MAKDETGTPLAAAQDDRAAEPAPWGLFMTRILGPRPHDLQTPLAALNEDRPLDRQAA